MDATPHNFRRERLLLLALLALAVLVIVAVITHRPWITGTSYWRWPWRDLASISAARWYVGMTAAALPIVAGIWIGSFAPARRWSHVAAVALLAIGVVSMKLASLAILTTPPSFAGMNAIVRSPSATSYYTDAAALAHHADWLIIYPQILPQTNLHTQSKPPGAVGFYRAMIRTFGYGDRSAAAGGIALAVLAGLSIPATFALVLLLTKDDRAASCAAILLALCPGFELIFPTFDATYPVLTFAMIATWHLAITRNSWRFAIAFGLALALTCFITYNLLVLGAFLVAWGFFRGKPLTIIRCGAIALATLALAYIILFSFTGFDPITTFRSAWSNQQHLLAQHRDERPYPRTILFDLLDFGFGAGWLIVPLAIVGLINARDRAMRVLMTLCLAQPIVVAIVGVLQSETARAWNFMLPLLILPAAIELARWSLRARTTVYAAMLIVLLVIGRNVVFMIP